MSVHDLAVLVVLVWTGVLAFVAGVLSERHEIRKRSRRLDARMRAARAQRRGVTR